jgi:MFS family permease
MTDIAAAQTGKLDIGQVISGTFQVIGRNVATFGILSLVLSGIPTAIVAFLQATNIEPDAAFSLRPGYFQAMGFSGLAALITGAILQGALVYGTVQDMNGQRASIADCLTTGLRAFLPLIGLSILLGIAVVFGLVLLIVPGIMMLCAWCVAAPALVADRTGVFGAFSRSAELTRGNRWRIFALFVVVWVIAMVIAAVIGAVAMALAFGGPLDPVSLARSPVQVVGNVISNTLSALITSTGAAVLYVELRRIREGAGPQWLAEIFS